MFAQLRSSSPAVTSLLPTTAAGASAGAELVTSDGRSLALVGAKLVGDAQGGLARLVLEQMFENTYEEILNVTYRMPLPADAAISGYEFVIGERVIKGAIDKKAAARDRFERAIAKGHTAAILDQERNDIFTQQIGNIPARETVVARITIDQRLVWLPEGEWELRFPTVIGPRYIGSADTAADVRSTHIKVTDQPLRATVQVAIRVGDTIAGGGKADSPSHRLSTNGAGMYELADAARLDRDIVLRWRVATPAPGVSLATARPQVGSKLGDSFGLLTIVPPARETKPVAVPRDLIVLLDTSGSMSGFPLDKAKQVVSMLIDSLDEHDRFELIEFNYQPTRYQAEPLVATAAAKQAAIKWIRSRKADGGTEIRAAVIEAMDALRVGAQRQVIVVTDGYVGGEQQIIEAMNRRLPKSCRVHVLGVGSAVNRSLASSLARAGRGVEVIIGVDEDAERGAKRLLDRTRMPVLTNVEVSGSALLRHAPALMPDCFEGSPLVAALALRPDGGELVVRGQLGTGTWEQTIRVPALQQGDGNQAIVALYGRERVADVEANALFSSVNGEVEELGLTFQISTRMTSWIAVDESRTVTGPSRDQLVPQELPYGTSAAAFGLRGGGQQQRVPVTSTRAGMLSLADVNQLGDDDEWSGEGALPEEAKAELGDFETEASTGAYGGMPADADDEMVPRSGLKRKERSAMLGGPPRARAAAPRSMGAPPPPARSASSEPPPAPPALGAPGGAPPAAGAPGGAPPVPAQPAAPRPSAVVKPAPAPEKKAAKADEAEPAPAPAAAAASAKAPVETAEPAPAPAAAVAPAKATTVAAPERSDAPANMAARMEPREQRARELMRAKPLSRPSRRLSILGLGLVLALLALLLWWLLG